MPDNLRYKDVEQHDSQMLPIQPGGLDISPRQLVSGVEIGAESRIMRLYGEAFSVSLTSPRFAGSPREPEWSNDGIQEGTATFHDEQILPTMKIAGNLEGAVGDDTTEGAGNSTRAIEDGDTKGRVVQG